MVFIYIMPGHTNHPDYEYNDELMKSLWQPYNDMPVLGELAPEILNPFADNQGNIWALPYEYKYPEVMIRKYNKDIMKELGADVPNTINEFYDLLVQIKNDSNIVNVLPQMKRGAVFSGFIDIVNAFGIKTSQDMDAFYSIQFDESEGKYVDVAFQERMKQCIDYFTLLIDEGIIELENGVPSSNDAFNNNLIFSVYEKLDRDEDLTIPYTSMLYSFDYEPKQFFIPSRYYYILGRDLEIGPAVNDVLSALYGNNDSSISARFGKIGIDCFIRDGEIHISNENYVRAPKLIGMFPDDILIAATDANLNELRIEILNRKTGGHVCDTLTVR